VTLGVVVPCYRHERWLAGTVAAAESALAGREWRGAIVLAAPSNEPLPELGSHWSVLRGSGAGPLTPGAARMAGFEACGGDWVLFVDADVQVDAAWLEAACSLGAADAGVGGIGGRLEEWFASASGSVRNRADMYGVGERERELAYLATLAFYRRAALVQAGGYDPRLSSEEDFELGMRMRWAGWTLRSLGRLAGRHWSAPRLDAAELGRRWRTGLCMGQGQVLRLYVGRRGFGPLLRRQGLYLATLGLWALGLLALAASLARREPALLAAWAALPLLVLLAMTLRKRDARLAWLSLLTWTVNGFGMAAGFLAPARPVPFGGATPVRGRRAESAC
jgi:hypothetical protein